MTLNVAYILVAPSELDPFDPVRLAFCDKALPTAHVSHELI